MRPWLKLTLCAAAALILGWGVMRSLARSAPITDLWGGRWFVAAAIALMVLGLATTFVSVLRKPSDSRRAGGPPAGEGGGPARLR
ncbi:hypothetical protein Q8W71_18470 [Methylobacterium sp. NEAU 140]|uniref:hypothetical protein n=1 Tax=Methylobacterium sp. NEAU 140 TaxID=3064945 RepID=UPI0027367626|nr:hypothetical protein [Methylobacterium sp. NEAU 140]MDP4024614.1 hypothetical protein [Methylobacterium sp. NEAU 140]